MLIVDILLKISLKIYYRILSIEYLFKEIDWSERCETPMGVVGRVRPRRLAEEAQLPPHGKRAS